MSPRTGDEARGPAMTGLSQQRLARAALTYLADLPCPERIGARYQPYLARPPAMPSGVSQTRTVFVPDRPGHVSASLVSDTETLFGRVVCGHPAPLHYRPEVLRAGGWSLSAASGVRYSGAWHTASTLLPSGSRTNAP